MPKSRAFHEATVEQVRRAVGRGGASASRIAKADALLTPLRANPAQLAVALDPARRIAVRTPRGAGKTTVAYRRMARAGLLGSDAARAPCAYVTYTKQMAKRILWEDLKRLNDEYELGLDFNNSELIAKFPHAPSSCWIELGGVETAADIDKYRGRPFKEFWIDEAKSVQRDLLRELIHDAVGPRMNDLWGTIGMTGTPGYILEGEFYEATPNDPAFEVDEAGRPVVDAEGRRRTFSLPYALRDEPGWSGCRHTWSLHTWTLKENPIRILRPDGTFTTLWDAAVAEKAEKGWDDLNPRWVRECLGRWCANDSERVYWGFDPNARLADGSPRNLWTPGERTKDNPFGLPEGHDWIYGLGCDLGFDNDFALEVIAYADTYPDALQAYEWGAPKLHVSAIADAIRRAEQLCRGFAFMVGDRGGLGTMIFAELERNFGISIDPAEKHHRLDAIELLNGELRDGRIKLKDDGGEAQNKLWYEMQRVPWEDESRTKIPREVPHDYSDAFRYLCTRIFHRFAKSKDSIPRAGSPEFIEQMLAEEKRRAFNPPQPVIDGGWRWRKFDLN